MSVSKSDVHVLEITNRSFMMLLREAWEVMRDDEVIESKIDHVSLDYVPGGFRLRIQWHEEE